jgi:16S rRNA processing protein RimM
MEEELLAIAKITKAQGNKGEVKVLPYLEDLPLYARLDSVYLDHRQPGKGLKAYQVENWRTKGRFLIMQFAGCYDRTESEKLIESIVKLPKDHFKQLPEGHFYWFEIEGLEVYQDTGKYLGKIEEILSTGSNDVYIVKDGGKEILLPATKEVNNEIDLANHKMIIHLLEGLI